ncbi:MAG: response regulator [Bacteroidales bacterium]|jgi:PAS domain S-box-containing protein|nr:response regulator [Bacteroidales bacterium]
MLEKPVSVLILESEKLIRKHLRSIVIGLNYSTVFQAETVEEALKLIAENWPNVIIYDLQLENDLPGTLLSFARDLSSDYLPYGIALSAIKNDQLVANAYKHGADYYLDKSFNTNELGGILSNISRQENYRKQLLEKELHYRSLFNLAADPILLVDSQSGAIVDSNKAARHLYGYSSNILHQMQWTQLAAKAHEQEKQLSRQLSFVNQIMQKKQDETIFPVSLSVVYFEQHNKQMALISVKDLTEILRHQEEKNALIKILQEGNNTIDFKETRAFLLGEENERRRIASEIHDHIGQLLVSVKLQAEKLTQENENPLMADKLNMLREQIVQTISGMRQLSSEMMRDAIPEKNLDKAINKLLEKLSTKSGLQLTVHGDGFPNNLSDYVQSNLYRIIEEALTNSIKHSSTANSGDPAQINLGLAHEQKLFTMRITSTPSLTGSEINKQGLGLKIMQQRAALIGGKMKFEATKEDGFVVELTLILNEDF